MGRLFSQFYFGHLASLGINTENWKLAKQFGLWSWSAQKQTGLILGQLCTVSEDRDWAQTSEWVKWPKDYDQGRGQANRQGEQQKDVTTPLEQNPGFSHLPTAGKHLNPLLH